MTAIIGGLKADALIFRDGQFSEIITRETWRTPTVNGITNHNGTAAIF
jgi:hypothetical protein